MAYSLNAYYKRDHGDNPLVLTTVEGVDEMLDALLREPMEEHSIAAIYVRERPTLASGFPDHELRVAVNTDAKVGGLRYTGSDGYHDGSWYASGAISDRDEVWYCYMGHDEDFPQDSEVPLDQVRVAIKELLTNGGERPTAVEWRAWP